MRSVGWLLVILGFALGFVFGFGVPLAEALPALGPEGPPAGLSGWLQTRPPWVGPMLLGVVVLTVAGWLRREPEAA